MVKVKKKTKTKKRERRYNEPFHAEIPSLCAKAVQCHQMGDLVRAESLYTEILRIDSSHADALHLLGLIAYQRGNNEQAAQFMRNAIQRKPGVSFYHNNLGNALFNMGNDEEALTCYQEAITLMPNNAEALNNLGNIFRKRGKTEEALEQYGRAIQINPNHDAALNNMANLLKHSGKYEEAVMKYEKALKQKPDSAEIHLNLGSALEGTERFEEAIDHYRIALELQPDFAAAHNNLGNVYKKQKLYDAAAEQYKKAMALKPDFAEACANLGDLYRVQGKFDDSLELCRKAVSLDPEFSRGYVNTGNALLDQGLYDEALHEYEKAINLTPGLADAHYNKGLVLLLKGEMKHGWEEYEWRFKSREIAKDIGYSESAIPEWDGSRLDGKSILILSEQGLGDHIQFVRYLPFIKELGGRVLFKSRPELMRLFEYYEGIDELLDESLLTDRDVKPDVCVQLLSLPRIFETTVNTIIADVPYLKVGLQNQSTWSSIIDQELFNVGLVWSGSKSHKNDRNRSCSLSDFALLADVPHVTFYSLQKECIKNDQQGVLEGMELIDLGTRFKDFYDTAAAIVNLDLVITVDTAVAHLAGALGKPVWTLLPYVPDWRWMLDRSDTPWYPTMRLFRQPEVRDWDSVIRQIVYELGKQVTAKGAS